MSVRAPSDACGDLRAFEGPGNPDRDGAWEFFCACLLHRHKRETGLSNAKTGPPIDKDGKRLLRVDGAPDLRAQPPAFLRRDDQTR